jgi:hypothetical protein
MNHKLTRCLTETFYFYQEEITLPFYTDITGRIALRHKDYNNVSVRVLTDHKRVTDELKSLEPDDISLSNNHFMVVQLLMTTHLASSREDYYQVVLACKDKAYQIMQKKIVTSPNKQHCLAWAAKDIPNWNTLTEVEYDNTLKEWVNAMDAVPLPVVSMSIQTPVV